MKKAKTTKSSPKKKTAKPIKVAKFYGDYGELSDSKLLEVHGRLVSILEDKLQSSIMKQTLYNLMEAERELTLRENQ